MIRALRAAAVAVGCLAGTAQATAIFTWQSITSGTLGRPALASVELSDAAFAAGGTQVNYFTRSVVPPNPTVERVRFEGLFNTARLQPGSGPGGAPQLFWDQYTTIRANLTISGGLLLGTLDAQAENDEVSLTSNADGLWLLTRYSSENPALPCRSDRSPTNAPFCSGATGRFVLTAGGDGAGGGTGQVPVLGVLPLMALASFGLAGTLRRRAAV